MVLDVVGASIPVIQVQNNVGYVTYGLQSAATPGGTAQNGNVAFSNGTSGLFFASIPIDTWP